MARQQLPDHLDKQIIKDIQQQLDKKVDKKLLLKSEKEALEWIKKFKNELRQIEEFFVDKLETKIREFVELQAQYISKTIYKAQFRWNVKNTNEKCKIDVE